MAGWQNGPFAVEMKAGETKAFCTCNLSKNGPYCDGSHAPTEMRPEVVKAEEDKTLYVCGCQASQNRPFCDGTHSTLGA